MSRRGRETNGRVKQKEVEGERERERTASISLPPTRTPVDGRFAYRIKGIPLPLPK